MKFFIVAINIFMAIVLTFPAVAAGKPTYKIALLTSPSNDTAYYQTVVNEINILLGSRYEVVYLSREMDSREITGAASVLSGFMADTSVDCVIGLGMDASQALVQYGDYPKPVIAGTILDRSLQGLPITSDGGSGIRNFNYIQSPFDIKKDLATFKALCNYSHLGIMISTEEVHMFHILYSYFAKAVEQVAPASAFSMVEIASDTLEQDIAAMSDNIDAVYVLPLFMGKRKGKQQAMIQAINRRKLPSFALLGEPHVRMGAMASIAPGRNFNAMARRVAINVLEIATGRDAGTLPVNVSTYNSNFVVNVGTFREIDYYPSWAALNDARLLNLEGSEQGRKLDLRGVIQEALERNLAFLMEKIDTGVQRQEVDAARAARLPRIDLATTMSVLDENRADGEAGAPARASWSVSGSLAQTVFSDDVLANHAIAHLLLESQKFQERAMLLDTVVAAAEAYIDYLFARSNQTIQNNNLDVTLKNLDIARSKEGVGSVDASEVYRWESEWANNQISLNDAYRDLQLARMSLNRILDRPIEQRVIVEDVEPDTAIELLITDPGVYRYLGNFKKLSRFSDFLIVEADRNLPELKQIKETLRSRERDLLNRKRAFYLPDVQLQANMDKIIGEYDIAEKTSSTLDHPWTLSATAGWPLFTGGSRRTALAKSHLQLQQTRMAEKELKNGLHFQVRAALETAAISAREIELSIQGLAAARKNFNIIQAGYAEGRNTIADLIDAQKAKLNSERGAAVARYQFVLDFLILERGIGRFHFLDAPGEKLLFLARLKEYMEMVR